MAGGDLHEITSILNKKGWAKKTKLSRTERELGAAFCARAGQSRPQQANRPFTCLSKPGTFDIRRVEECDSSAREARG